MYLSLLGDQQSAPFSQGKQYVPCALGLQLLCTGHQLVI